ncbi:hypothetical protein DBV15_04160 [Temnothorax longispinosus]|uniref:Uncharacterized protein n=1 Tax=Temnothorax longispinosus TaxID=300112 RepID=A0A4S2L256_9HYME|nr:hypothetical protein DBV15_04160 [Temnothorax longispinosus]
MRYSTFALDHHRNPQVASFCQKKQNKTFWSSIGLKLAKSICQNLKKIFRNLTFSGRQCGLVVERQTRNLRNQIAVSDELYPSMHFLNLLLNYGLPHGVEMALVRLPTRSPLVLERMPFEIAVSCLNAMRQCLPRLRQINCDI